MRVFGSRSQNLLALSVRLTGTEVVRAQGVGAREARREKRKSWIKRCREVMRSSEIGAEVFKHAFNGLALKLDT